MLIKCHDKLTFITTWKSTLEFWHPMVLRVLHQNAATLPSFPSSCHYYEQPPPGSRKHRDCGWPLRGHSREEDFTAPGSKLWPFGREFWVPNVRSMLYKGSAWVPPLGLAEEMRGWRWTREKRGRFCFLGSHYLDPSSPVMLFPCFPTDFHL
jgi:hypothetical protein